MSLKSGIFKRDINSFSGKRVWAMLPEGVGRYSNIGFLERPQQLGIFILDSMQDYGKELSIEYLKDFDKLPEPPTGNQDDILRYPYEDAKEKAECLLLVDNYSRPSLELDEIERHVKSAHTMWLTATSLPTSDSPSKKKSPVKQKADIRKADMYQEAARLYAENPQSFQNFKIVHSVDAIKASCAYCLSAKFAFSIAFGELCSMKAKSCALLPTTVEFGETMAIMPSMIRAIGQTT